MIRLELKLDLAYDILDAQGADFVFNIHAAQTPAQLVTNETLAMNQDIAAQVATDPLTATRIMRLHVGPGPLTLSYKATIDLRHHKTQPDALAEVPMRSMPLDVMQYVYPSRYCQSDRLIAFATIFGAVQSQAPVIRTKAFQGGAQGFVLPHHCNEALSTAA